MPDLVYRTKISEPNLYDDERWIVLTTTDNTGTTIAL